MKKLFSLLAIGAIVLGMASCGDKNSPEVKNEASEGGDFKIEVKYTAPTIFDFTITAEDESIYEKGYVYTYFYVSEYADLYLQYGDSKAFAEAVAKTYIAGYQQNGKTFEDEATPGPALEEDIEVNAGEICYIIAYRFNDNYQMVGNMSYVKVTPQ